MLECIIGSQRAQTLPRTLSHNLSVQVASWHHHPLKRRTQNVVTIWGCKNILRISFFFAWRIVYGLVHKVGRKRLKGESCQAIICTSQIICKKLSFIQWHKFPNPNEATTEMTCLCNQKRNFKCITNDDLWDYRKFENIFGIVDDIHGIWTQDVDIIFLLELGNINPRVYLISIVTSSNLYTPTQ